MGHNFFGGDNLFLSHFSAALRSGQFRGQKSLGPLKKSLEMAQKVIVPQKKNYVPHFLKQRDINSYCVRRIFPTVHPNIFLTLFSFLLNNHPFQEIVCCCIFGFYLSAALLRFLTWWNTVQYSALYTVNIILVIYHTRIRLPTFINPGRDKAKLSGIWFVCYAVSPEVFLTGKTTPVVHDFFCW